MSAPGPPTTPAAPAIRRTRWGEADGQPVERFELSNDRLTVGLLTYGATIQSLLVPDQDGQVADVALGFDDLSGYLGEHPYFGSVIGRFANRIAGGRFILDGERYQVPLSQPPNSLHGGTEGFDRRIWSARAFQDGEAVGVEFGLTSPHGDMGFPGTLRVSVAYKLKGGDLTLAYSANVDRPTVVNLTNHVYFNLAGSGSGTIERHVLSLAASRYTPVDENLIPTGELAPVEDTPMDFRQAKPIGSDLRTAHEQLVHARGYDHNWVLDRADRATQPASPARSRRPPTAVVARVHEPTSGRQLEVSTDQPGVQFYSGNFLDATLVGKGGRLYRQGDGFCLETQHFPDSPNSDNFPSTVLRPNERYETSTTFRLSCTPENARS